MKPHELIGLLVRDTGKSTLQVAIDMRNASFQPTLYRFISGDVASPTRRTAEIIAKHFGLSIDALYDVTVATAEARARGYAGASDLAPRLLANEEPRAYKAPPLPSSALSDAVQRRIATLSPDQLKALERVIDAHLDAVAPVKRVGKAA